MTGKMLLITRPEPLAAELAVAVRKAGGRPIVLPMIEILPPDDLTSLSFVLNQLNTFDWAIFISPSAVLKIFSTFKQFWPENLKTAAIGQGTSAKLRSFGVRSVVVPSAFNSESFLAIPAFQHVQSQRIVIFKGEGGRGLLAETLRARGADVFEAVAYRRECPARLAQSTLQKWKAVGIDAIVITSQEALLNLLAVVGELEHFWLKSQPLIVTSPQIRVCALSQGFQSIRVADNASNQAIIDKFFG